MFNFVAFMLMSATVAMRRSLVFLSALAEMTIPYNMISV